MHSQNAADAGLSLLLIHQLAEFADLGSRMFGATQQLRGAERHFLRAIFFRDAISARFLTQVLAKKFGCAMNAGIGPALFPAIQIRLRFLETLKAHPFEGRFLGVADPGLDFSFSIWISDPASERHRAIMGENISIEGVESRSVDVGHQHALFQVVEDYNSRANT